MDPENLDDLTAGLPRPAPVLDPARAAAPLRRAHRVGLADGRREHGGR
ncbi:hypothetical protein [Kitasatospora fiedleri]|nr:hypothetical protein [Kitasatospora fiedleri]